MQQRQLRLGDILDDYCPRKRRVTNHAVVAMVDTDVKQTRCTTCDTEHDYKHAKVPRQRRKAKTPPALYAQVLAGGPKRVVHDAPVAAVDLSDEAVSESDPIVEAPLAAAKSEAPEVVAESGEDLDEAERSDDSVIGHAPLTRTIIVQNVTKPKLALLLHRLSRRGSWWGIAKGGPILAELVSRWQ